MALLWQNRCFKRLGAAAVMIIGLCAVAVPTAPAQARVWVGVNVPFLSVGVGAPGYYYPYYHAGWRWHSWCYHHPYRCRHW